MKLFERRKKGSIAPQTIDPAQRPALINVLDHGLVDSLAPAAMDFTTPDCCSFSPTEWLRVWYVRDWPRALGYGHWRSLLAFPGEVRVSLFMQPLPPMLVSKQLEQQATAIQASRFMRLQQKRDPSPSEDKDYQEIMEERHRIEIEGEPFYYLSAALGLIAASKDDLDRWSEKLENQCRDCGLMIERAVWEQDKGLQALLPHNANTLGNHERNARLDSLMNMFPFVGNEIVMPEGVFYGYNISSGMVVTLDPFALENPNTVIIGIPGSGKSYFMKDLIEQYLLNGARVYVLDIEDEYRLLCDDLGGVYLDMGIKSEHKINVLDPDPNDEEGLAGAYQSFRGWLIAAIGRGLMSQEIEALDKAYYNCFARCGIFKDDNATLRRTPPLLSDLHDALVDLGDEYALGLASAVYPMARGMEAEAFNCATNIDVRSNPLVVFGLKTVPAWHKRRPARRGVRASGSQPDPRCRAVRRPADRPVSAAVAPAAAHCARQPEALRSRTLRCCRSRGAASWWPVHPRKRWAGNPAVAGMAAPHLPPQRSRDQTPCAYRPWRAPRSRESDRRPTRGGRAGPARGAAPAECRRPQ